MAEYIDRVKVHELIKKMADDYEYNVRAPKETLDWLKEEAPNG